MLIETKTILLKNGKTAIFRSPEIGDAAEMVKYLKATAEETPFLMNYPEEKIITLEQEEGYLRHERENPAETMIVCEVDGKIAGTCHLSCKTKLKNRHRGRIGIALYEAYWGMGIGTAMFRELIALGRERGLSQLELEVFEGNKRGIALYEKMGFRIAASVPDAIRLKDGTSWAEHIMVLKL